MRVDPGCRALILDRPIGDDALAFRVFDGVYPLVRVSADEMRAIASDEKYEKLRSFPRYYSVADGTEVTLWPPSEQAYEIVRVDG